MPGDERPPCQSLAHRCRAVVRLPRRVCPNEFLVFDGSSHAREGIDQMASAFTNVIQPTGFGNISMFGLPAISPHVSRINPRSGRETIKTRFINCIV